jgi:hypothetical protein
MKTEKQIGSAQGVNYRSAQGVNYRRPFAKTEIAGILGFRADPVVYTVCTAYRYTETLPPTLPPDASTDQILAKTPSKNLSPRSRLLWRPTLTSRSVGRQRRPTLAWLRNWPALGRFGRIADHM